MGDICTSHWCDGCRTCLRGRCCRRDNPEYREPGLGEWNGRIYGRIGVLDRSDDVAICHACGRGFAHLGRHVWAIHDLLAREYRLIFGLPMRQGLSSLALERRYRERQDYTHDPHDPRTVKLTARLHAERPTPEQMADIHDKVAARNREVAAFALTHEGRLIRPKYRADFPSCTQCGKPARKAPHRNGKMWKTCSPECAAERKRTSRQRRAS